jgi:hypothetical protein
MIKKTDPPERPPLEGSLGVLPLLPHAALKYWLMVYWHPAEAEEKSISNCPHATHTERGRERERERESVHSTTRSTDLSGF